MLRRTFVPRSAAIGFAALLAVGVSWILHAQAPQDLWFIQMSDPQFGMFTSNHDFEQETANFELAIATANRLKPNFVVICGDLTNQAGDAPQITEFRRIAAKLDRAIGLHLVAGNHDVSNSPTPQSLAAYRRAFGKDYYAFEYPGFEGIVLNSSLIQHPEAAPEEAARQEQWLSAELARASQTGAPWLVVFQHIPFFVTAADEPDGYFNIPQPTRARYLKLLESSGVRYVFAGHTHYAATTIFRNLHMIIAGPVGMPLNQGASGLRIVHVRTQSLQEQYFDFGHLPNRLDAAFPADSAKPGK